jgi:hypothetical protein
VKDFLFEKNEGSWGENSVDAGIGMRTSGEEFVQDEDIGSKIESS